MNPNAEIYVHHKEQNSFLLSVPNLNSPDFHQIPYGEDQFYTSKENHKDPWTIGVLILIICMDLEE